MGRTDLVRGKMRQMAFVDLGLRRGACSTTSDAAGCAKALLRYELGAVAFVCVDSFAELVGDRAWWHQLVGCRFSFVFVRLRIGTVRTTMQSTVLVRALHRPFAYPGSIELSRHLAVASVGEDTLFCSFDVFSDVLHVAAAVYSRHLSISAAGSTNVFTLHPHK